MCVHVFTFSFFLIRAFIFELFISWKNIARVLNTAQIQLGQLYKWFEFLHEGVDVDCATQGGPRKWWWVNARDVIEMCNV